MLARRALAALLAARAAADGGARRLPEAGDTIGSAVVQHVKVDLVFDASESMQDDVDSAMELSRAIDMAIDKKMDKAEKRAKQQVFEKYKNDKGKPPPADSEVDLPKHELMRDYGWSNSKGIQRFGMSKVAEFKNALKDTSTYKGEGDLKKALELCQDADGGEQHIEPPVQQHPSAAAVEQWMRRVSAVETLPGVGDGGDQHDKLPKRICIIITDDRAMCDKDEKSRVPDVCMNNPDSDQEPEETLEACHDEKGDLGDIQSCTDMVKSLREEGTQVAILSKKSSYEIIRMRNDGFIEFLKELGCPEDCFTENDMSSKTGDWKDVELKDGCCSNYVAADDFGKFDNEKMARIVDNVLGELTIFDVFLSDADGVPPAATTAKPDDDGPDGHHGEGDGGDGGGSGGGSDQGGSDGGGGGKKLAIFLVLFALVAGGMAGYYHYQGRQPPPPVSQTQDVEMSGRH